MSKGGGSAVKLAAVEVQVCECAEVEAALKAARENARLVKAQLRAELDQAQADRKR